MLIGQDIGPYGGTFGVTRGLYETYGEEAIRDAPLCESGTVGYAIGLAITGVRAVCEIEFFDFVGVAMDQIFNQAAKLHYFTGGKLTVPLVIRTPIVARMGMGPQHSQSLESWFMHIPGIKIAVPSNAADAYGLMRSALVDYEPRPLRRERAPLRAPGGRRARRRRRSRSGGRGSRARARTPPSSRSRAWSTRRSWPPTGSRSAGSRSR